MQYGSEIIPVCHDCLELEPKTCLKCGMEYCMHFSSTTDVRFCGNCMSDFTVVTETEVRITESANCAGQIVYTKRDRCKHLKLQGTDWLFTERLIHTLTDEELDATIEYHRAICSLMLSERQDRQVEKYAKMSKLVIKLQASSVSVDSTGAIRGTVRSPRQIAEDKAYKDANLPAKKKAVRTKTTGANDANAVASAMALLLKNGITQEQLTAMLGSK